MQLGKSDLVGLFTPIFHALEHGLWFYLVGYDSVVWVRQPELHRDDRNRCHRDGGPAFVLPDQREYFWHGTLIPEEWGKVHSEKWNPRWLLEAPNAEHKRVLLEGIGYERVMNELGSDLIHHEGDMELRRIKDNVDVEPIVLLKVVCPSTQMMYALRVPPTMTDCEEARSWCNWGIKKTQFVKET